MKNKFTRFLCFFLCFALCFAWLGPPQEAHAAGGVLVGVLLMFLVGAGIGVGINGTAHSLADGFEELVESYETNVYDGNLDFWDVLAIGSSIGTMGEVLLDKAATDLLNGFMNWLQSDKGWTEGDHTIVESSSLYISAQKYSNGVAEAISIKNTSISNFDSPKSNHFLVHDLGTVFSFSDVNAIVSGSSFSNGIIFYDGSYRTGLGLSCSGDRLSIKYYRNGSLYSTYSVYQSMESLGYTYDNVVGFTYRVSNPDDHDYILPTVFLMALLDDGTVCDLWYQPIRSSIDVSSNNESVIASIPPEITFPDTSDWDDSTSLGLFTGHSGKIPTSVEEYNDFVLQDLNSGVVPEVSTDVIVGTPDQVLPDEGDGTLSGTVSEILAQVMALPQNIANLILDGVKSIFIPDPDHLEGEFMGLLEELNDVYSFDFDLDSLFSAGKEPEDIYDYYPVAGKSLPVLFVSWHYLKKGVEYFRPYIRGFIVLMLIFYNLRQFMAIFGLGGVMNGDSGDNRRNDLAA